ncbi:bactericidal permeability-increasing protein isoform X2 [Pelodiscus sinensis]|uniref:bactericidal permeability-increasing protein isoform X2 n=1 Tax=Pelodiscus sinensis TaxID=13735 RepID=UPI003F6D8776
MVWGLVLVLLGACSGAEGADAGVKGRVTQKGLQYGQQFGLELALALLRKEQVPDLNGSYNLPLIGVVGYSVSRIRIQELQLSESSLSFSEGTGVRLVVSHARILLSGVWRVMALFVPDSGSFHVSVSGLSLSAELGVSRDDSGRPQVWSASCHSTIGRLDVKFHGGASWLYNLFTGALQEPLRHEVNKQLCLGLRKGVSDLERALKIMPVTAQLDPFAAFDYSLVSKPMIARDHGDMDLKGEFYGVGKHTESPFSPAPFLLPDEGDRMLLLGLSEFSANSAAFVYFTAGALRKKLTDSMIPKRSPIRLNTRSLGLFCPQLKRLYPGLPMELHLSARKQPLLTCRPGSLALALAGAAEAFVVLPNATLASAFLLHLVKVLEKLLKLALRLVVLPMANKKLREGFPLPSIYNLSLADPHVTVKQGFVLVATDVQYKA